MCENKFSHMYTQQRGVPGGSVGKNLPVMQKM